MHLATRTGALLAAALLPVSIAAPSWGASSAPSAPSGDQRPERPGLSSTARPIHIGQSQLAAAFKKGNAADRTKLERDAVRQYLDRLPDSAVQMGERDVKVATVRFAADRGGGGLASVIVAPVEAQARGVNLVVDPETSEISAGVNWTLSDSVPTTTGPGMWWQGAQYWSDVAEYKLELKLYLDQGSWNDYLGRAEFNTKVRRQLNDGPNYDRWQVGRIANAYPQVYEEGIDQDMFVKKLWISNDPVNGARVLGWNLGGTAPQSDEDVCEESDSSFDIYGGWSWTPADCEEYGVFRGSASDDDAGHYRIYLDQGAWINSGSRKLGYRAAYEMKEGVSGSNEFYEFVTLSEGNTGTSQYDWYKCKANGKGQIDTDTQSCWYNNDGGGEDWAG